jgi:HSP20 family protein
MENFLRRGGLEVPEPLRRLLQGDADLWLRVEEFQEGTTLVVRTDAPGVDPEKDVDITVSDDTLHIDVRRGENKDDKDKTGYRSEVRYGEHSRSIPLPRGVSQDGILATYTDGVIEIRIQLPEQFPTPSPKVHVFRPGSQGPHQSPEAPENYVT